MSYRKFNGIDVVPELAPPLVNVNVSVPPETLDDNVYVVPFTLTVVAAVFVTVTPPEPTKRCDDLTTPLTAKFKYGDDVPLDAFDAPVAELAV
jgi:hypothetical protein